MTQGTTREVELPQRLSAVSAEIAYDAPTLEFALSVARGLSDRPRRLECRYLYDTEGSRIFEEICTLPEYYLTRAEHSILQDAAEEICATTGEVTLVELGSGSSTKTQVLLSKYAELFGTVCYTPVDVSKSILDQAEQEITSKHPSIRIQALHGTYDDAFCLFSRLSPAMLLFLGSTIGNLDPTDSDLFWRRVCDHLSPGDFCLLGIDTNTRVEEICAAYDDAAGVSARFTGNLFSRMNKELGAGVDLGAVRHVAEFNGEWSRVEIYAEFKREQDVVVAPLRKTFRIPAGERILTEISRKYDVEEMRSYLSTFALATRGCFTDVGSRFAVLLLERQ